MNALTKFSFYFLFFAIVHSFLAMDITKNIAQKLMGKRFRYYRIMYFLISFPLFAPALMIWITYSKTTPLFYVIPQYLYLPVMLVHFLAICFFGYALLQLDLLEFTGIKIQKKNILLTGGAFGIVRHPLYSAGILFLMTKMEMSRLDMAAVILISGYLITGAIIEEKRMQNAFGDEYRKYKEQVSMFIPVKWFIRKLNKK